MEQKYLDRYIYDNPNYTNEKVTMTVALPAYKCHDIIWLALESLKKQIMLDFHWELICIEEYGYSRKYFIEYAKQFPNCKRVIHVGIDPIKLGIKSGNYKGIFPLINKWMVISELADKNSHIFVMHASDDYSPPKRLHIHNEHFKNPKCIISSQPICVFYNVKTKKYILYNALKTKTRYTHTQPNMAYNITNVKKFVTNKTPKFNKYIDGHILKCILNGLGIDKLDATNHLQDIDLDKDNWKYGLFTDGFNTISLSRSDIYDKTILKGYSLGYRNKNPEIIWGTVNYFKELEYNKLEDYIPANVLNKFNYNDNNLKKNLEKTIQKVNSIETFDNYVKSSNNKISTNDCKIVLVIVVLVFALYLCLKK